MLRLYSGTSGNLDHTLTIDYAKMTDIVIIFDDPNVHKKYLPDTLDCFLNNIFSIIYTYVLMSV